MKVHLSPRQTEVVRLVSLGCSTGEIAKILKIARSTADNHRAAAMRNFGTDKSALLARLAIKHKLTKIDDKLTPTEKRRSGRKNDGWN